MGKKENCWEFFNCGRETGGRKTGALGVCPAAADKNSDGLNGGRNGGRICWAIAGTFCDGEAHGTFARKSLYCGDCDFFKKVKAEEGFLEYKILKPDQIKGE